VKRKKAAKTVKSLPSKTLGAKAAKGVKGGSISLNYGKIKWTYTEQKPDGSEVKK
jgi:type VI protein secretion system component Hcp